MELEIGIPGVRVRTLVSGDVAGLVRHANDPEVARHLRQRFPHPYTAEDARWWIEHSQAGQDDVAFGIEVDGEVAGCIGLVLQHDVHRFSAELGYWLGRAHWRRQIMSATVRRFSDWVFANLPLQRLYASVFVANPASARVLEKAGFEREGLLRRSVFKNEVFLDEWLYARLAPDPDRSRP